MISSQLSILQNARDIYKNLTPTNTYSTSYTTQLSSILGQLVNGPAKQYLTDTEYNGSSFVAFYNNILVLGNESANVSQLQQIHSSNPYYTSIDYTNTITNTSTVYLPISYQTKQDILQNIRNELSKVSVDTNVNITDLEMFNDPTYTKYNTDVSTTYEDGYRSLYSKLYDYYSSYEPDNSTQYLLPVIPIDNTAPIDTYNILYQGPLRVLGEQIRYHDTTYSSVLDTLDTVSTLNTLNNKLQGNTYLTQNEESIDFSYGNASKYITYNEDIVYTPPPPIVDPGPSLYEVNRAELFNSLLS
jgi:hypothetical protein